MPLKKAVFLSESLPPITSDTKYFIRYRITSDDNTLKSQWSSIYELEANKIQDFTGYDVITNVVADGTFITYTVDNSFAIGDNVVISGIDPAAFNFAQAEISLVTPSSFTITNTTTGTYVSGGVVAKIADTLSATVSPDQRYILLQWEPIGSSVVGSSVFDVFAQWSTASTPSWSVDNYEYVATISSNNFSVLIPVGATYGKFVVQITTHDNAISATTIQSLGLGEVVSDTIYDAPDFDGGDI
jgi:hypothetical protein